MAFYKYALINLDGKSKDSLEYAQLLDEAGDVFHRAKRFDDAERMHLQSLSVKRKHKDALTLNDMIYSFAALATDLYKGAHIVDGTLQIC